MQTSTTPLAKKSRVKGVVSLVIFLVILWIIFGGGSTKLANAQMDDIKNQVAQDAVKQYEIAKRQGDKMQTYTQASMAAQAFLQAKDEPNYAKWKAVQDSCAREAGIPQ